MVTDVERFKQMLLNQAQLNSHTNPQGWFDKAWYRAFWTELAELMDWLDWPWWKSSPVETEDALVEYIDAFHFAMSDLLASSFGTRIDDHAKTLDMYFREALAYDLSRAKRLEDYIEECVRSVLEAKRLTYWAWVHFFFIGRLLGIDSVETLQRLYEAKRILNAFRQDHGYKTGDYRKIWDGKEDNIYMVRFAKEGYEGDALYQRLEKEYQKHVPSHVQVLDEDDGYTD